ncbi:Uncharacterised protein [Amycolatopsis camponoti]|uniref:Uncharacterized protein n=1 Tax=Amycolatopsis camponoti TaxID=2606593 RepID=A0A6I8LII8_9PSEU|nr:Uncharacterised protein [Amycolatopsis camponoti]
MTVGRATVIQSPDKLIQICRAKLITASRMGLPLKLLHVQRLPSVCHRPGGFRWYSLVWPLSH